MSGVVLGDSEKDPQLMENHADRPEFNDALSKGQGVSIRHSPTLEEPFMYFAIPYMNDGETIGVVRVSIPLTVLGQQLRTVYYWIAITGLIIAVLAAVISFFVSRSITKPIEEMQKGAHRYAQGEYDYRMPLPATKELSSLAEAFNDVASKLGDTIKDITEKRNELEAVLSSMVEGVIAFDINERLFNINQAAADILGISKQDAINLTMQEVIRNPELQEFISQVLKQKESREKEIAVGSQKVLQINGTIIHDADGKEIGALIVFNDISDLKKLEIIRRDFVANVSHELRTPITAIKGFVETLRDGAIADKKSALNFLEIINKNIDRLNAIIQDLLSLSKIEQESEQDAIKLENLNVIDVLEAAIQSCSVDAYDREVYLMLESNDAHYAMIDPARLEQAVINLLTNAIKYSDPNREVKIRVDTDHENKEIIIRIQDFGCGIAEEHLPRIFERFYRVDTDRSRKLGGTGLGLAIVKHIALAHKGYVSVDSELGIGSTFRIHLPK
jgi:two-component system phosphate regulon sensor histidine kinase PhoR